MSIKETYEITCECRENLHSLQYYYDDVIKRGDCSLQPVIRCLDNVIESLYDFMEQKEGE